MYIFEPTSLINEEARGLLQSGKALNWDSYGTLEDVIYINTHTLILPQYSNTCYILTDMT